jgi:predicted nucleic acid-binding protein
MRIFLDANILFSAAKSQGVMRGFLATLRQRGHPLVVDAFVLDEARRNLEAKFPGALGDFEAMLPTLEIAAKVAPPLPAELVPGLPWKDRPVLAAAIFLRCQILLTGDKSHFGPLYGYRIEGVVVESPAGLAAQLE